MITSNRTPARWSALLALAVIGTAGANAQTLTFSNIWSIPTGVRDYITTQATERGIAVNPVTGYVLVVSRAVSPRIVALDGETGEELLYLETDPGVITEGTFTLSTIGVADDGVIYAANLASPAAENRRFKIYRWEDEFSFPTVAYVGVPSDGQRFGDCLDVRGAGANTQIAVGAGNAVTGVRFAVFTTPDGENFEANIFSPQGVAADVMQKGITFGPDNTVIGKRNGTPGYHVSFDLATGESTLLSSVPIANNISPVDLRGDLNLLAGINYATHELLVYDVSNLAAPNALGAFTFPAPATANGNGVGAVDFGAGLLVGLDTQNGVLAYQVKISSDLEPPVIISQPLGQDVLAGANVTFTVGASGTKPFEYQWSVDDVAIEGATGSSYSIAGVQEANAGIYKVQVRNVVDSVTSDEAVLTVRPLVQTGRLVKLWGKAPGDYPWLAADNNHRGMTYNQASDNVLIVSRSQGANVYVLDGQTGDFKHQLRTTDAEGANLIAGGYFLLNMIAAADDGAIYVCNLSLSGTDFKIYRWADDAPDTIPTVAYGPGNPGIVRCGDVIDARGSGAATQILVPSRNGKTVALFLTADGSSFEPTVLTVADATDGNFGLGATFGLGDTFWGKSAGEPLRQVAFDPAGATASTLHEYSTELFPGSVGPIGVQPDTDRLAGLSLDTPDNVQLYSIADLEASPVLLHQELFVLDNPNANGTGAVDFGDNRLYALYSNNGILAFEIRSAVTPEPPTLSGAALSAGTFSFTLSGVAGSSFRVQYTADFVTWTDVGTYEIPAGGSVPVTHQPGAQDRALFYRAASP